MSKLKTKDRLIASHLIKAESFKQRFLGLIGKTELKAGSAFFIPSCPSIHTFFMKFSIDVIFTDKKLCIISLFEAVPAGKILFGGFKSRNVFELKAGQIQTHNLKKGDILYVES